MKERKNIFFERDIEEILENLKFGKFGSKFYLPSLVLNDDGSFDYNGSLDFSNMGLNSLLEIPIKLRKVDGSFFCNHNNLISLEGSPKIVTGSFLCTANKLISLKGSLKRVGESFHCDHNNLISLQYAPKEVGMSFWCTENPFISIKNSLLKVNDSIICFEEIDFEYKRKEEMEKQMKIIESMTFDQRQKELEFFWREDKYAYDMMRMILDSLDLGYGKKTKEMVELTESYDIGNLI